MPDFIPTRPQWQPMIPVPNQKNLQETISRMPFAPPNVSGLAIILLYPDSPWVLSQQLASNNAH